MWLLWPISRICSDWPVDCQCLCEEILLHNLHSPPFPRSPLNLNGLPIFLAIQICAPARPAADDPIGCSSVASGEESDLDAVRQLIHAGLDAIERARSGLRHAVDDLVEEGTISRDQAEAVLEAWRRKTDREETPPPISPEREGSAQEDLKRLVQKLVPVSRVEHDRLVARVQELEQQLRCR